MRPVSTALVSVRRGSGGDDRCTRSRHIGRRSARRTCTRDRGRSAPPRTVLRGQPQGRIRRHADTTCHGRTRTTALRGHTAPSVDRWAAGSPGHRRSSFGASGCSAGRPGQRRRRHRTPRSTGKACERTRKTDAVVATPPLGGDHPRTRGRGDRCACSDRGCTRSGLRNRGPATSDTLHPRRGARGRRLRRRRDPRRRFVRRTPRSRLRAPRRCRGGTRGRARTREKVRGSRRARQTPRSRCRPLRAFVPEHTSRRGRRSRPGNRSCKARPRSRRRRSGRRGRARPRCT